MVKSFSSFTLLLLFTSFLFAQSEHKNDFTHDIIYNKNEILNKSFKKFEILSFSATDFYSKLRSDDIHEIDLNLGNAGGKASLKLWHDYQLQGNKNIVTTSKRKLNISHPITMKGFEMASGKTSRLTFNRNFIFGYVTTKKGTFYIEPLRHFVKGVSKDKYIVYNTNDVIFSKENTCGAATTAGHVEAHQHSTRSAGECLELELATASDYSMFLKYTDVEGVNNHNMGVMNNVQGNYDDEFADEIQFVHVEQYVVDCENCDPWTSSNEAGTVLSSFSNWAPNGFSNTHDLGQFWTNRDFDGSTVGIAWVGVVCETLRYHALSDFTNNANFKRVMVAHEIGHNFNAQHDPAGSEFIMAPAVQNTSVWSATSISVMEAHYNSKNCLATCAPPAPPESNFEANYTTICTGSSIQFFDKSLNNPTSWTWSFDGGSPSSSNEQHPVVSYETPGSYQVSLTVESSNGSDAEVKVGYINVVESGGQDVLILENFEEGLGTFAKVNPDGAATWELTSPSGSSGGNQVVYMNNFDYNAPGQFDGLRSSVLDLTGRTSANLKLEYAFARYNGTNLDKFRIKVSTDGGSTYPNTVFEGIEDGSGNFATVMDQNEKFTPVNSSEWCVATNYGPSCVEVDLSAYVGESQVVVLLENENGYGNNIYIDNVWLTASCQVIEPPVAAFNSNAQEGCTPFVVQFSDQSTNNPTEWLWTFEGGSPSTSIEQNPTIWYETEGEFLVTLTATNSAGSNTVSIDNYIQVQSVPTANFVYTTNGNTVVFTNTSSGSIDSYNWNFGDNSSSIEENPVHTYLQDGTYTVTLTVSNECGSATHTAEIVIDNQVEAAFTSDVSSGCVPLTVSFTDNSSNATSWAWTFDGGNPSTSTDQNPTVIYHDAGTYNVQLIASNDAGSDTTLVVEMITANDVPMAGFTKTIDGLVASFTNTSTNATSYSWNFGDGGTSQLANPIHEYQEGGQYIVEMVATNDCGSTTVLDTFIITDLPTAGFASDVTSGCTPLTVVFNNQSSSNTNSYLWTFEGGSPATSTEENPTVVYNSSGAFDVTLVVTNSSGSDTLVQSDYIIVGLDPVADFSADQNGNVVNFTNESTDADSYSWDFGDGSTSNEENPFHTYASDGTYTVTLVASNGCGTSTKSITVTIVSPVTADASANMAQGCTPFEVTFNNQSSDNATNFVWTFEGGQPASSTEENPTVIYNEAGVFDVRLIASNGTYSDTLDLNNYIVVNSAPQADMSFTIDELTVSFMNQSTNGTTYSWDFGDGNTSTEENPTHTYAALGQYTVVLIVTNSCGSDTITNNINVSSIPTANFSSSQTEICEGETVSFTNSSTANATSFLWEFEGGTPSTSTEENPVVTYQNAGVYDVKLTATNDSGSDVILKEDFVKVGSKPTADFTYEVQGASVILTNTSQNATSYLWSNNANQDISMDKDMTMIFAANGDYEITLEATNSCGTDKKVVIVTISGYPNVSFSSTSNEGCQPYVISYNDISTENVISRKWEFPGGTPSTSTEKEVDVTYNEPGVYNVVLVVENEVGTSTRIFENYAIIHETPTVDFTFDVSENTVNFESSVDEDVSVEWDFGDGNTSSDLNPIHTYEKVGTYTVTLTASNEHCTAEITKKIMVDVIDVYNVERDNIQLYPNPNNGSFVLKLNSSKTQTYNIELLNNLGQILYTDEHTFKESSDTKQFDFDISSGLYFMKVYNDDSYHLLKVVIKR